MFTMLNNTPLGRLMMLGAAAGGNKAVEDTATGNPLTFLTDLAKPLKSLLIPFTPKQEGTGDPSPQNIRSIIPWNGLTVWNGGKNLFNKDTAVTGVWWKGNVVTGGSYNNYKASDKIPVLPNVQYMLTRQSQQQGAVCYFDKNKQYVDQQTWDKYNPSRIIPDGVYYITFTVEAEYIDSAQLEVGQTATAYEPYKIITENDIVFPSPVYGGVLDAVTGVLMDGFDTPVLVSTIPFYMPTSGIFAFQCEYDGSQREKIVCTAYKTIAKNYWNQMNDLEIMGIDDGNNFRIRDDRFATETDFLNYLTQEKIKVCLPKVTPQEIQLTPQQITAIIGNNTIWSDADGQLTAVYLKKA